jgi:glycine betaine/proline transport system permease protein
MSSMFLSRRVDFIGLTSFIISQWPKWAALLISISFLAIGTDYLPAWAIKFPRSWTPDIQSSIASAMYWLVDDAAIWRLNFSDLTRGIAWLIEFPMRLLVKLLATGFQSGAGSAAQLVFPPIPWVAVVGFLIWLGYRVGGPPLAILHAVCFFYLVIFDHWNSAMITLASIVIAVPLGILGGAVAGILAHRYSLIERVTIPILDLMQTVPTFAYLVPILFLFGFGPAAAIVATIIYAMPPMVRITLLSLKNVPMETKELGHMVGCSDRQFLWKILIPSAQRGIMVGVNQVIMLSLNMVIIASMIGAGGLGYDVLISLRRLDVGRGLEAGLAIVLLAIVLDRFSQALANHPEPAHRLDESASFISRHGKTITGFLVALIGAFGLGQAIPAIQTFPDAWTVSTAYIWQAGVSWININLFDYIEAVKTALLLNVLIPFKKFLLAQPWPWVLALVSALGYGLGGIRLAALTFGLVIFILLGGLWPKAVITVYLCGIAVSIATLIGVPIGILAAENRRAWKIVHGLIDTLQTLPTFVFLIPVVMLLRIGDVAAIFAVVSYAIVPAIRYAAHGLSGANPQLLEAGLVSGCTKWQLLWKVRIPMAFPEILLGLNQTVMMALSMLVITALVGTRDLGQEVFVALSRAEPGKGIVAGLSVAAIAILTDRLLTARAKRTKERLGLA